MSEHAVHLLHIIAWALGVLDVLLVAVSLIFAPAPVHEPDHPAKPEPAIHQVVRAPR